MNIPLPTAEELQKLPMRAVVAYAARTARRLSSALRGVVADDILDDMLRMVEAVTTTSFVSELRQDTIANATQRLASAYAAAPVAVKSLEKFRVVFSLTHAALAVMHAIEGAEHPERVRQEMKSAAREAQRVLRTIDALNGAACAVAEAAQQRLRGVIKSLR